MRGYELEHDRARLREQGIRAWEEDHPGQAATTERLLIYATDAGGGNRSRLIRNALVIRGLQGLGIGAARIATAMGATTADVQHDANRELVAHDDVAALIEVDVLKALPETPEPSRHVAVTWEKYSNDDVWRAKEALIDQERSKLPPVVPRRW